MESCAGAKRSRSLSCSARVVKVEDVHTVSLHSAGLGDLLGINAVFIV